MDLNSIEILIDEFERIFVSLIENKNNQSRITFKIHRLFLRINVYCYCQQYVVNSVTMIRFDDAINSIRSDNFNITLFTASVR